MDETKMAGRPTKPLSLDGVIGHLAGQMRRRRARRKLTVPAAAEAAGVDRATWYSWEQGRRVPDLAAVERIAAVLGCRPRDLLP